MSSLHNGNSLSSLHHGAASVTQKPHPAVINQVWPEILEVAKYITNTSNVKNLKYYITLQNLKSRFFWHIIYWNVQHIIANS